MTNHNLPPAEDAAEPMTLPERIIQARDASVDILATRPHTPGRNVMGEVIITEWLAEEGTVKCQLSTPTDNRKNEFLRLEVSLTGDDVLPSVYVYSAGTTLSARRRITFGKGLEPIDELELLLRACPLDEDTRQEDVGPENPMISDWEHGSDT